MQAKWAHRQSLRPPFPGKRWLNTSAPSIYKQKRSESTFNHLKLSESKLCNQHFDTLPPCLLGQNRPPLYKLYKPYKLSSALIDIIDSIDTIDTCHLWQLPPSSISAAAELANARFCISVILYFCISPKSLHHHQSTIPAAPSTIKLINFNWRFKINLNSHSNYSYNFVQISMKH